MHVICAGNSEFVRDVALALGFDPGKTRGLRIYMDIDDAVTVRAEQYVYQDEQ